VFELPQCLGLNLPNSLARHRELLADFLQRVVTIHAEALALLVGFSGSPFR
jgi:hypothetical protein